MLLSSSSRVRPPLTPWGKTSCEAFLSTVATTIASVAMGMIGGLLVLPVGLILHEVLSWLLVLAVAGAFATLGATWAGTLLNPGGEGVLFMPVLVGTGVVALGLWGVRMSPGYGNDSCIFDPFGQSADMPAKPDSKIMVGLPSPMHEMCNR